MNINKASVGCRDVGGRKVCPDVVPINEIKALNKHFFQPESMRFFASKLPADYAYKKDGYAYFITSEQFRPLTGPAAQRKYTIRKANLKTGDITSVGEFQEFASRDAALKKLDGILGGDYDFGGRRN